MRGALTIAVCCAIVGAAARARGQSDVIGVRAMGMGEAMRAIATGPDGPVLNPAGIALVKQYVMEANYGFRVESLGHQVRVSIADSVTSRLAAGLYYTYVNESPQLGFDWAGGRVNSTTASRSGHAAGLSLSYPIGDRFFIGATVKYLHLDTTAPLPPMTTPPQITLDTVNGISFDVGVIVRFGEKFNIGVVGYNLWDHGSRESPLSLGVGLAYVPVPQLSITFDTLVNFTGFKTWRLDPVDKVVLDTRITARLGPGLEWLIAGKVPLRAGVVWDQGLPATYLTVGLGYLSPAWGVNLGYRGKVQGGIENTLLIGIRVFVN